MPWINDLKIRGNWGRLGNSSIGDWDYIGTINQSIVTVFGGAIVPGSTWVKLVNAGLVWETKETVNVGFDASFLNQRLTVSAEYYNSKTSDVLAETPIAISTGNQGGSPWKMLPACATRASSLHLVGKTRFQALSTALY